MKAIRNPSTTIAEASNKYIQDAKTNDSHHTVRERQRAIRHFIQKICWEYSLYKIEDIHPDHVEEYVNIRRREGNSDITIKGEVNYIRGLCSHFNHTNFLNMFKMKDLQLSSKTIVDRSAETPWLSIREYQKVIAECSSLREELICRVGWETGIRRSEASSIDTTDIDGRTIQIESAKRGKNDSETRLVYVRADTKAMIHRYIKSERNSYPSHTDTDALFITERGRMHKHTINEIFKKIVEEAGIQKTVGENSKGDTLNLYTYHSLRHSFAIHRLENGINLQHLADLLGDTVETVSENYLNSSRKQLERANESTRPNVNLYSNTQQ